MPVQCLFLYRAVLFALLYWHIAEALLLAFVLCKLIIIDRIRGIGGHIITSKP